MNEKLLSYAILFKCEMITIEKYNEYLNELFFQHSENDLLLELQWCSKDSKKTFDIVLEYLREIKIDYDVFGKYLMNELKVAYNEMEINGFATKAYSVWKQLPESVEDIEPFFTLNYADEPLSWGDEKQSRELYEKMFDYYRRNDKC